MATIVDQRSSHPLGGYYDQEYQRFQAQPNFNNSWGVSASGHHIFNAPQPPTSEPYNSRSQYAATPAAPLAAVEPMTQTRPFAQDYSSAAPTSQPSYTATSNDRFPSSDQYPSSYGNYEARYASQFQQQAPRRPSYGLKATDSFNDALDAGRGMVAMSQQDFASRGVYQPRNNSTDSYTFPSTQSDHGSVSSSSSYPYYSSYSASVDGSVAGSSVTDYSSNSDELGQRTLPPPGQLINGFPPDASHMMTQFNSKLAANAQKKHKCKICDKRFTRPSSLQTHMYSHTGEKPFACDFEGCGRHFSVVSNLRRHKKCHKGGSDAGADSPSSPAISEE